jgi:hypothetical protein
MDLTDSDTLTDVADFVIGTPLKIIAIVLLAMLANRIARRGMKRALRALQSGAVQERIGSLRAATPDALLRTTEHSLRSEQRIEALASVLRSLVTVVIYLVASFMILGEVGIELGPLLAGAGILGIALGFGSQTLVRDFLSGMFILIEDQFGVGDIVNLDTRRTPTCSTSPRSGASRRWAPTASRSGSWSRPARRSSTASRASCASGSRPPSSARGSRSRSRSRRSGTARLRPVRRVAGRRVRAPH